MIPVDEPDVDAPEGPSERVAALRRDFAADLGTRMRRMRDALDDLGEGFTREAAERLYHPAHSLKGTAASFGAGELSERAGTVARLARDWLDGDGFGVDGPEEAARRMEALDRAVERFRERVGLVETAGAAEAKGTASEGTEAER